MRLAQDAILTLPVKAVGDALALPRGSVYRRIAAPPAVPLLPAPPRGLSCDERSAVLAVLNSDRFMDDPPRQV